MPHWTGGDGDLFKIRPGRLDKQGYAPTAIGYGWLMESKPKYGIILLSPYVSLLDF